MFSYVPVSFLQNKLILWLNAKLAQCLHGLSVPRNARGADPRQVSSETASEPALGALATHLNWAETGGIKHSAQFGCCILVGCLHWSGGTWRSTDGRSHLSCGVEVTLSCAWRSLCEGCSTGTSPVLALWTSKYQSRSFKYAGCYRDLFVPA